MKGNMGLGEEDESLRIQGNLPENVDLGCGLDRDEPPRAAISQRKPECILLSLEFPTVENIHGLSQNETPFSPS
jgi:hypothetical protein